MTMKLQGVYDSVNKAVTETISQNALVYYTKHIIEQGSYKDLGTRIAHDVKCSVIPASEICRWYDEYNCNDNHITTLFKKVLKESYPEVWELIQKYNH